MHEVIHVLGLDSPSAFWYLLWSGVGGYLTVLIGGIVGFAKLYKQRNRHHQQLKDHIDYKFEKLGE